MAAVSAPSTNSAIVFMPMPRATSTIDWTTTWSVGLLDQAVALGRADERGRRDQLAVVAAQAQQQLPLRDLVGGEVHDRLAEQLEAVLVEPAADLVDPAEARLHAGQVLPVVRRD